uniref:Oligosaccharyltransferase complex subunit n=1 Tax=Lynceus sp. MCZ IZ 141354 TaxID=1930659 RepID=A0A9N6WWB4_9CRUS|nr:EOG090X0H7R [Lynceus sp. MCZ IZ 141354]
MIRRPPRSTRSEFYSPTITFYCRFSTNKTAMDTLFQGLYSVLEVPNLKIKRPSWIQQPSAMTVFSLVLLSYFLVTGGIIYDVIVEPPSIGSTTDERGHSRPVAFMPYRVNGQYILEGLASSFMFTVGGLGYVILDHTQSPTLPRLNRLLLIVLGFICVIVSFFTTWIFMRMKLPGYLQN